MTTAEFEQARTAYLDGLGSLGRSLKTYALYELVLRKFGQYLSDGESTIITPLTIDGYRRKLSETNISTNTCRHYLVILHSFFNWCVKKNLCAKNFVDKDDMPKIKEIDYDLLTLEEITKLLEEPKRKKMTPTACRNRAIVVLLIQTGLRNSDLRNLTIHDLDFQNNTITVRHGKGDKKRIVAFPQKSREAIREYLNSGFRPDYAKADDVVFGTTRFCEHSGNTWHELTIAGLNDIICNYTRKHCGHCVGTHRLRHAYASLCDYMGIPLRQIQLSMGHASAATTTKIYIDTLDAKKHATAINAAFDSY